MEANSTTLPAPLMARRLVGATLAGRFALAAVLFGLVGLATLAIDVPASNWLRARPLGDGAAKLFTISESFSHGLGVALILLAAAVLDAPSRRKLPRAAAVAFGAGLLANLGKLVLARRRPRAFAGDGTVWETFHGWLPWLFGGDLEPGVRWGSQLQSFPSAHAATGCGLAIALSWLYPRGRWLFAALAILGALQRVDSGAHYFSDVLFGAAIGCLTGAVLLGNRGVAGRFSRWENAMAHRARR